MAKRIIVDIDEQLARLLDGDCIIRTYPISSSAHGTGFDSGSNKTPTGRFKIHKKIGEGFEKGTVFKGRLATDSVCGDIPRSPLWQSNEDLILSRILWLEGLDPQNLNTLDRFIYFHGTNQEHLIGTPASHGCIRLSNDHIIELFSLVEEGTEVDILSKFA